MWKEWLYPTTSYICICSSSFFNVLFQLCYSHHVTVLLNRYRWFKGDDEVAAAITNVLDIEVMPRELHGKDIVCEATNSIGSTRQHQTLNVECRSHRICVCYNKYAPDMASCHILSTLGILFIVASNHAKDMCSR